MATPGTLWIVLSQCSTLNPSVLGAWMMLLARSKPPVRGILGYESKSPNVGSTIRVVDGFIRDLVDASQPQSLLEAWRRNNRGTRWTAVVHQEARSDRLRDLAALRAKPLGDAGAGNYRFYSSVEPEGAPIDLSEPPFALKLEGPSLLGDGKPGQLREITVATMSQDWAKIYTGEPIRASIHAPAGEAISQATVTLVNVRHDDRPQFSCNQIFSLMEVRADGEVLPESIVPRSAVLRLQPPQACKRLVIQATARPEFEKRLQTGRNYFWLDVDIRTDGGARYRHEFKAKGWRL